MTKHRLERIFLSPPHMGGEELNFIKEAFESNYIAPVGPMVDAFEKEFAEKVGIAHAVAVASGTAAMHLALRVLGVRSGDEVIASTLTFIGGVSPVIFQGANLTFVDCDRSSWNMDPDLLAKELKACQRRGRLPKAVIPTDLYGQCCDLQRILDICHGYDVPVICDSAEALGAKYKLAADTPQYDLPELRGRHRHTQTDINFSSADPSTISRSYGAGFAEEKLSSLTRENEPAEYRHAGSGAKAAIFSFNGNKIITTSSGGMLVSDDKEFIDNARNLSQQAREPFPTYEHKEIGYNYRMSNILSAIGRGQLRVLDERVKRKRKIFDYYQKALGDLPGIEFMPEADYGRCNRWLTVALFTPEEFGMDREALRLALDEENIEARPIMKPMHMQPVFNPQISQPRLQLQGTSGEKGEAAQDTSGQVDADYKKKGKRYKARVIGGSVAEDLFNRGLCLPSGTTMTEKDLDRVIDVILSCRGRQ